MVLCQVPRSLGSAFHESGNCKRCCFFPRNRPDRQLVRWPHMLVMHVPHMLLENFPCRCLNGYECEFCHYEHEKRKRKNKKNKKKKANSNSDFLLMVISWTSFINNKNMLRPSGSRQAGEHMDDYFADGGNMLRHAGLRTD